MGNAVIGEYKDYHHNSGNNNEDEGMINRYERLERWRKSVRPVFSDEGKNIPIDKQFALPPCED